jgi:hypothetical protein
LGPELLLVQAIIKGHLKNDLTCKTDFVPGNFNNSAQTLVKEETA